MHSRSILASFAALLFAPGLLAVALAPISPTPVKRQATGTASSGSSVTTTVAYLGCFPSGLAFDAGTQQNYIQLPSTQTSPEYCVNRCSPGPYYFIGGSLCFCSASYNAAAAGADGATCTVPCSGNTKETCGGTNPDNLSGYLATSSEPVTNTSTSISTTYSPTTSTTSTTSSTSSTSSSSTTSSTSSAASTTSATPTPTPSWHSLGCYQDTIPGALRDKLEIDLFGMTQEKCQAHCSGYKYAGLESGIACVCDNTLHYNHPASASECSVHCPGNHAETCGGIIFRLNLFEYY